MPAASHRGRSSRTAKLGVVLMAAASLLLIWMAVAPPATADPEANNWYICKYVGKPGVDEQLQTGQNPIFTDENAIPISPVFVGAEFADAQGRSIVIAGPFAPNDRPDPEPDAGDCPPPDNPCPSGTTTVIATETETATATQTFTTTVTAQPDAALGADGRLNVGDGGGDTTLQEQENCTTTTTQTEATTTTVPTTVTTTVPLCPEGETTTTVTQTVTTTVTADQALQQDPACTRTETTTSTSTVTTTPPECPSGTATVTTTSTAPPVTETETVTDTTTVTAAGGIVNAAAGPNPVGGVDKAAAASEGDVLQQVCEVTSTVVTTPTETVTDHVTTTTTVTPIVSGSTVTPPPTTTDEVAPTTVTPPGGTAFTGAESVVPLGALALMLMSTGSGLLWAGSRRRDRDDQD
jgi:hypothetical protein